MNQGTTAFEQLRELSGNVDLAQMLDFLADKFRQQAMYCELFEAMKMKSRHSLGLPILYSQQPDDLSEQQQLELEDKLLDACRDVGTLLIKDGRIADGWMYLQPLADRKYVSQLIRGIQVDEDNIDIVIDIALRQAAAPQYGYQLMLEHQGTCNSITTFDTCAAGFARDVQENLAAQLVDHVYQELMENIISNISDRESAKPTETRIEDLIANRDWLFEGGGHHLDVTHLASIMRIARSASDPDVIKKALEMAQYGQRLHSDFHFAGQSPFEDTYPDHAIFFRALLGEDINVAIEHFRGKVNLSTSPEFGAMATEHLVALLTRLGRNELAIEIAIEQLANSDQSLGIAPQLVEIANTHDNFQLLMRHYENQQDLLGFAISLMLDKEMMQRR